MTSRRMCDLPRVECIVIDADAVRYGGSDFVRERTCRMDVCGDPADPSLNRSRTCSACGAHGIYSDYYDADCHITYMRYCPECGARVVGP